MLRAEAEIAGLPVRVPGSEMHALVVRLRIFEGGTDGQDGSNHENTKTANQYRRADSKPDITAGNFSRKRGENK
jgi:hypothetical protein